MPAEVMQITYSCQNSIVFIVSLSLSRPRLRNLQRPLQENWVWIRDILIDFTERFFFDYARSSSLNFFVKNKSVKTSSTKYDWYYFIEAVRE